MIPKTSCNRPFHLALQVGEAQWIDATAVDSIDLDALGTGCIVRMADGARIAIGPRAGMDAQQTLHWLLDAVADQARRTRWARAHRPDRNGEA